VGGLWSSLAWAVLMECRSYRHVLATDDRSFQGESDTRFIYPPAYTSALASAQGQYWRNQNLVILDRCTEARAL
jgi:hypothetical protein